MAPNLSKTLPVSDSGTIAQRPLPMGFLCPTNEKDDALQRGAPPYTNVEH